MSTVTFNGKTTTYSYDDNGNRQSLSETYVSSQPSDYKETISGTAVQYKVKNSQYTYSNTNKLLRNIEYMQDGAGNEQSENVLYVTAATGAQVSLEIFFMIRRLQIRKQRFKRLRIGRRRDLKGLEYINKNLCNNPWEPGFLA